MVVALVGPTASGKSQLALDVVRAVRARAGTTPGNAPPDAPPNAPPDAPPNAPPNAPPDAPGPGEPSKDVELLSVDSMAVYRGMDIGTTKPTPAVRAEVRYHLLDLVDPDEEYTVTRFQGDARDALADIGSRGNRAMLVGGTGLYLRSVTDDLSFPGRFPRVAADLLGLLDGAGPPGSSPRAAVCADLYTRLQTLDGAAVQRIEPGNERRIVRALEVTVGSGHPFSSFGPGLERYPPTNASLVGLRVDDHEVDRRIADRFERLLDDGLLDEVRELAARPAGLSRTARQALGYRELLSHVESGVDLDAAVDEAVQRTRRFARRQRAWFRRDPRIEWVGADEDPVAFVLARLDERETGSSRLDRCVPDSSRQHSRGMEPIR